MNSDRKHHSVMNTQHLGVISRGNSYSVELEHNINAQNFSVHSMFQSGLTKILWPHFEKVIRLVSNVKKSFYLTSEIHSYCNLCHDHH